MSVSYILPFNPSRKSYAESYNGNFESKLTGFIGSERIKQGLSQKELAKKSDVPQSTIARMLGEKVSCKIDTLLSVLEALGYTLSIVPKASAGEADALNQKDLRNIFDEYMTAVAALDGIKELDSADLIKMLYNVMAKQHKQNSKKVKQPNFYDDTQAFVIYQDVILIDSNKPLSVMLEASKYISYEGKENYSVSINNAFLGHVAYGSKQFEYYFSQIKFFLDSDNNIFSYTSFDFLETLDEESGFNEYLEELIDYQILDEGDIEIVKQIIEKGYATLSQEQRKMFVENVLDYYYVDDCVRCGSSIEWNEMLMASQGGEGDSLCGYCRHMLEKLMDD